MQEAYKEIFIYESGRVPILSLAPGVILPCYGLALTIVYKIFFVCYVMASGGLYSLIYITTHSP